MTYDLFHIVIFALGVWRLSSLFANEDGPFNMFKNIRALARHWTIEIEFFSRFKLIQGLECEWCNSIWFATPIFVLWYVYGDKVLLFLTPLVVSTLVIGIKYVIHTLSNAEAYLYWRKEIARQENDHNPFDKSPG